MNRAGELAADTPVVLVPRAMVWFAVSRRVAGRSRPRRSGDLYLAGAAYSITGAGLLRLPDGEAIMRGSLSPRHVRRPTNCILLR